MRAIILQVACAIFLLCGTASAEDVFYGASLEPPGGRVISGWGQFSGAWNLGQPMGKVGVEDLAEYEKAVAPHPPAMISFSISPNYTRVAGFLNYFRKFSASHGFFVAQVGLNFRGSEHDVSTGMRDPDVIVLADGFQDVGRPLLLQIGPKFNQAGALYEASGYIGSFRHVTDVMRKAHMSSAMVWDATASGLAASHYLKWYPGDDVVDWWGLEVRDLPDLLSAKAFIDDAAHHRKPLVINWTARGAKSEAEALKWYASFFDFLRANPSVKAFSLITDRSFTRWPKVAAYVKQQLADHSFIDATEAPAIFRPPREAQ
jgi:hypothetical protein